MRDQLDLDAFEHAVITGYYAERKTIAQTDEDAFYSRELDYNKYIKDSEGIIGILVECDGNASDTLAITVEFSYGGTSAWTTKTISLDTDLACNTSSFFRVDITSNFRDCLPFTKLRIKYQKTGTNAALNIKSRIIRV